MNYLIVPKRTTGASEVLYRQLFEIAKTLDAKKLDHKIEEAIGTAPLTENGFDPDTVAVVSYFQYVSRNITRVHFGEVA